MQSFSVGVILNMITWWRQKSGRKSTLSVYRRKCRIPAADRCFVVLTNRMEVVEMTRREEYEAKTEKYLLPLMEEHQFELVDVEYVKEAGTWYLRAYIDKEGGITVDDCEIISRKLGEWLDKEDFIEDSYILEVSSPGLGRPLKKEKDYKRSIGKDVEIRLYRARDKQKEFIGTLKAYDEKSVTITCDEEDMIFEKADIALIRLAFDF